MAYTEFHAKNSSDPPISAVPLYQSVRNRSNDTLELVQSSSCSRVHSHQVSLLDLPKPASYGISNLLVLLLMLSIGGDLISSINKHGVLIDPIALLRSFIPTRLEIVTSIFLLMVAVCMVEITLACALITSKKGPGCHYYPKIVECIVLLVTFILPPLYSWKYPFLKINMVFDPTAWYIILWMKLCSFITYHRSSTTNAKPIVDQDTKCKNKHSQTMIPPEQYLTRSNMYYFILAPTLCFEPSYPKVVSIRLGFLVKKIIEFIGASLIAITMVQQLFVPSIVNFNHAAKNRNTLDFFIELIHLSAYVNIVWLLFFFLVFHCLLNILAEILLFGDRGFYHDWWNSCSIAYFWKTWNIPVHRWFKYNVYNPLFESGYNRLQSSMVVFFLSAVFHEYMASSVLKLPSPWSFLIMSSQIPMSFVVDCIPNPYLKNFFFWTTILSAQLSGTLLYAYFYNAKYHTALITAGVNIESIQT